MDDHDNHFEQPFCPPLWAWRRFVICFILYKNASFDKQCALLNLINVKEQLFTILNVYNKSNIMQQKKSSVNI